jgi:hypothetical protein
LTRSLKIGARAHYYFSKDRKAEIAKQFGLTPVTASNIRERFLAFCEEMDMSASYKPVLLLCLLETVSEDGAVSIARLTLAFRAFYLDRVARGLPPEKPRARMAWVKDLTEGEIQRLILDMPFKKFARRGFLDYGRDVSRLRFAPALLGAVDRGGPSTARRRRARGRRALLRVRAAGQAIDSRPRQRPPAGCRSASPRHPTATKLEAIGQETWKGGRVCGPWTDGGTTTAEPGCLIGRSEALPKVSAGWPDSL